MSNSLINNYMLLNIANSNKIEKRMIAAVVGDKKKRRNYYAIPC